MMPLPTRRIPLCAAILAQAFLLIYVVTRIKASMHTLILEETPLALLVEALLPLGPRRDRLVPPS